MKHFFHIIPFVAILITAYFVYHGIYGNRGLLRLEQIRQEYAQATQEAENVSSQKKLLQKKVEALKNGAPDLVQEEALRVLNMGGQDSLIILDTTK